MHPKGRLTAKFVAISVATLVIVMLAMMMAAVVRIPVENALIGGGLAGFLIGVFEEFYVQSVRGKWLRTIHPLTSLVVYGAVVVGFFFIAQHAMHGILGTWHELSKAYARLPIILPAFFIIAIIGVLVIRVIGFIGARDLFSLMIGRYHRPVLEDKVFLFLDMKDSTATAEALGAVRGMALIAKFLFDISRPITDHGGNIYQYTGDGLIAMWDWDRALENGNVISAIDGIYAAIENEAPEYQSQFGRIPLFRIGVHGGRVVISEEGDTKRAIGIYGDPINIAARMEQTAKSRGLECIISEDVVSGLSNGVDPGRFNELGKEQIKGISQPISIYELRR